MAISLKGIRYVFYNREFMSQINSYTNYWSNMSILAHEVGHHINGHTTDALLILNDVVDVESLSESRKMELEADEFAGFVLAKLGATLTQASEAIALMASDEDDTYSTHPSKSKRIAAITKGHNKAKVNVISYEKTSSSIADEYFYSGVEKSENGDYYGAIADYSKSIEIEPNSVNYYNRGYAKTKLSDYYRALPDYDKAIELWSNNSMFYEGRGILKVNLKDYYGAIEDFTKAIKLEPNNNIIYYNRGIAKRDLKDFSGAIADFTKAIKLNPNYVDAYNNRAFAKGRLKDHYGSIEDFTKAIELEPKPANIYYNRGISKGKLKDYSGACADWRIAARTGHISAQNAIRELCN